MHPCIYDVCDAIISPDSEQLLRLLRTVLGGDGEEESLRRSVPRHVVDQGVDLCLLKRCRGYLTLTDPGYLIGSVAKEYCNWIDNDRRMPPPRPPVEFIAGKDVLDLGCSYGRWLWEFQKITKSVTGLELQQEYIELGRALARREGITIPEIRRGSAEELDSYVADNSVDFVFARLVFNHVYIKRTLRKVAAVLRPGGIVWIQVEAFSQACQNLLKRDRGRELRNKAFASFAILNSITFMTTGTQLHIAVKGRMHGVHKPAYPTLTSWRSILARVGLKNFQVAHRTCVFWAQKL